MSAFSPAAAERALPVEPVALPPAVEQGVDMVYVDPEIAVDIRWRNTKLDSVSFARYAGAPLDLIQAINPLYTELRRGLVQYQKQGAVSLIATRLRSTQLSAFTGKPQAMRLRHSANAAERRVL